MENIKGIIDRFEGEKAVIRANGEDIIIPKKKLPDGKEGDVVTLRIDVNKAATEKTRKKVSKLLSEILKGE